MSKWATLSGLKALSLFYLLSASAFSFALALQEHQPWAEGVEGAVRTASPTVAAAAREGRSVVAAAARSADRQLLAPAIAWAERTKREAAAEVSGWFAGPEPVVAVAPAPKKIAAAKPPILRPSIVPPAIKPPAAVAPPPNVEIAQPETEVAPPPLEPAPDASPPSAAEIDRVLSHLKVSLTRELYDNFNLFLYVSKAERGPWHQRMFVFQKQASGDLSLLYTWPVSTGREVLAPGPEGNLLHTDTPQGYFQIDPDRVFRRYRSSEWDHDMPHAMFFSWEHDGIQTGIAIHGAVGDDIASLGTRSSAGCIRIHPQNATLLFNLIKKNYRGLTPLFAYDKRTATMSSNGLLMHDKAGNLEYAEGYKVLILVENTGGEDTVAALF